MADLTGILILIGPLSGISPHSPDNERRERMRGHGFYLSPTEDARLARLRRGAFFTSVR